jgi:LysR family carnitine catabolism transcriptional activator
MLSIRELQVFLAVVETGGIRGAADRLSRTASAVSMSLKQIEADLGAPLFEGERKTLLTSLGRTVFDDGRDLLEHYQRACGAMYAAADNEASHVEIACTPSVAVTFLPEIVRRLGKVKPAVQLRARDMDSRSVREAVTSGAVDVGVASFAEPAPGLHFRPLFSDRLALLCRSDSKLARTRRPLAWRELEGYPFIAHGGYGLISDPAFFELVRRAQIHLPNVMSLFALVKAGEGVTVMTKLFELQSDSNLRFLPLADPEARQMIGIIGRTSRRHSPAALSFLGALEEVVRKNHSRLGLTLHLSDAH